MAGAAAVLPAAEGVPAYRSWTHLRRNERAVQTGLQQFYLDETGARAPPPPPLHHDGLLKHASGGNRASRPSTRSWTASVLAGGIACKLELGGEEAQQVRFGLVRQEGHPGMTRLSYWIIHVYPYLREPDA